jgi:hypothetical protein
VRRDRDELHVRGRLLGAVRWRGGTAWVGLVQLTTATRPADGWTWNGTTPVVFTNWQSGVPDDRDNDENGAEQCAKIQPDGTWDDVTCSSPINFFCERP